MAADNIQKLRLYKDMPFSETYSDENHLATAFLTQPDVLTPVITHLVGREDKRFPLSFLTEGTGRYKYINDTEYDYPVIGQLERAIRAVRLSSGTGVGHTRFKVVFSEKWFIKSYLIEGPNGTVKARIMADPEEVQDGWEYTCQLISPNSSASISAADVAGKNFIMLFSANAMSGSRGNSSNWVAPSKMRNQISLIRKSYGYEGNHPNRYVNVEFNLPTKGKTRLWYDMEEWQYMLQWMAEVEYSYWYNEYNRDEQGTIHLKDDNGKPIPLGSGVLEQIPNVDQYAKLTATKLKNVVTDALYGASDSDDMNVVLFTGLGGLREFDDAMKDEVAVGNYIKNTPDTAFIRGGSDSMEFGGFFTSYKHIDGHSITVRHLPLFDKGARALNSEKHPVTGLPLESYRMVFLDMSNYDGEPNVYMVTRKGREMVRAAVAGMSIPPGFSGNALRASDIDGASVHYLKECGIAIRRATNCLHLECVAS